MKAKRIVLGISICAVLAIALTLIPVPGTVHAQSGSITCRVGFCAPPVASPCGSGGGTPPFSGSFGYAYGPAQGTRAMLKFPLVAGCNLFVTNINGSVVTNNPTGNDVATVGVWQTNDQNCAVGNLINSYYVRVLGTNLYQLSDRFEAPAGVQASVPYNASAAWACIGFRDIPSDWWETINFGYGYE